MEVSSRPVETSEEVKSATKIKDDISNNADMRRSTTSIGRNKKKVRYRVSKDTNALSQSTM